MQEVGMFRTRLLAAILVLSAVLFSCSGKDGAAGPAGPAGVTGADGNAKVLMFQYGTRTTTTGVFGYAFNASRGLVDSSLVLGYYQEDGTYYDTVWYAVPGLGPGAAFLTRFWILQTVTSPSTYSYMVQLRTQNGSATYLTSTTFAKFKIILVPASVITPLTSRGLLDLSDYNAVAEYLNLSE
jgi:hypothetical protein